jgi:hypothetical protein
MDVILLQPNMGYPAVLHYLIASVIDAFINRAKARRYAKVIISDINVMQTAFAKRIRTAIISMLGLTASPFLGRLVYRAVKLSVEDMRFETAKTFPHMRKRLQ